MSNHTNRGISRQSKLILQREEAGQLSLMPAFQAVDRRQTSIAKLLTSSLSTPTRRVLPILGADLISEERDLLPYWSEFVREISDVLWLPTKTDYVVSGLTSSSGCASITGAKSWFSTRTISPQSESWWRTYSQLSTYSAAACTDLENISSKSEKTSKKGKKKKAKKYKKSSRHQSEKPKPNVSHKVRVYPDASQRQVWWNWMSACRKVYNLAIAELRDKGLAYFAAIFDSKRKEHKRKTGQNGSTDSQYFRNYIMGLDLPEWVKAAPCHIKQNAIEDAWDAFHQAIANGGAANFRSCKAPSQAIRFNFGNFINGQWYPTLTKGSFTTAEPIPNNCTYSTTLVKQRDRWYAIFPEVRVLEPTESKGIIALDPGVRTFLTGFDGEKVIELAPNCIGRIYRLCQHLDKLLSRASKAPKKKRRQMHRAANRMRFTIQNLVNEVHHQVAAYLTDNYRVIYLPTFESSNMVRKSTSQIGRKSVRAMMTWAHYRFKQHLKQLAARKGVVVVDLSEAYTSKTCTKCGHIHPNLHRSKTFKCPNCGYECDRDANGARGIMLRALRDTAFLVSNDEIAVAVCSVSP